MVVSENSVIHFFPGMPDTSKVWIYQANRFLSQEEANFLSEKASLFCKTWESHGSMLEAQSYVFHNLFLVFAVDELQHEASGCSIDKSVHFVKEIQHNIGVDFFNRTIVSYVDKNNSIKCIPAAKIKEAFKEGEIDNKTLIFNNLINDLHALRTKWTVLMGDSWVSKIL
ncbi:MAG TPA: hypothetical protein VK766_09970 [Cytophagaceae bacterium]|jgi:hypothetical protein|nr:hypothetical protein [Cytophagaceae bacterium]